MSFKAVLAGSRLLLQNILSKPSRSPKYSSLVSPIFQKQPEYQPLLATQPTESFIKSFTTGSILGLIHLHSLFTRVPRQDIIYSCLKYEKSWMAAGTNSTKQLGQVRGSTRKAFRQKGRGKARVGTIRAPQFRGGYHVHGPRPSNQTIDIQRKVYTRGIASCLATKFRQDQIVIVDELVIGKSHKEECRSVLERLGVNGKKLFFIHGSETPCRHLLCVTPGFVKKHPHAKLPVGEREIMMAHARHVTCRMLLEAEILVIDKSGLEALEEMYS